jgi:hypothetical protein
MQFYKITCDGGSAKPAYQCSQSDAREFIKQTYTPIVFGSLYVELVELPTHKHALANLLSGWGVEQEVLRTWKVTKRGGLKEIGNEA